MNTTKLESHGAVAGQVTVKAAAVTAHTFDDAIRFRWLTEDHADKETRAKCRELLKRMGAMSYGDVCAAIDSAMADEILRMMKSTAAAVTPRSMRHTRSGFTGACAVAIVAEVHMSRYTVEWTNGPLPEGTPLYAAPLYGA